MRPVLLSLLVACSTAAPTSVFDGPDGADLAQDLALDYLAGLPDHDGEVVVDRVQVDELGMAHVRVQH